MNAILKIALITAITAGPYLFVVEAIAGLQGLL